MDEVKYITLNFNDIFELKRGKVISKKYIKENPGEFPVYSTQIGEPLGYISNYMYEGKYLIWNTDGLAGYIRIIDEKFSITNIVGIMLFKENFSLENISLEYVKHLLEPIFRGNIKGRMGEQGKNEYSKLNSTMIMDLNIQLPFPINDSGEIDLKLQNDIASKYEKILGMKKTLLEKRKQIEEIQVSFLNNVNFKGEKISNLLEVKLGDGKYTQEYCMDNKGDYPVYSGNTVQAFSFINEYSYDGEFLTWAKDGLAGYLMYHNGKFSITNHRGILIPKKSLEEINLQYIKIMLEPIFRRNIKGRLGIKGKNEYTTLSKDMIAKIQDKIAIPIKADGSFDYEKQCEIAEKYNRVFEIKTIIIESIDNLLSKKIEY